MGVGEHKTVRACINHMLPQEVEDAMLVIAMTQNGNKWETGAPPNMFTLSSIVRLSSLRCQQV